jgi:hypothetical protein
MRQARKENESGWRAGDLFGLFFSSEVEDDMFLGYPPLLGTAYWYTPKTDRF